MNDMNDPPRRLYDLLPLVHRQRDAERGAPLLGLLQVIDEQVRVVDADITQLYDNWFIETCQPWVVPYIGDLLGYRPTAGPPGSAAAASRFLVPRRAVANTIRNRRRKGTLALLEELAEDVAGWPARAVEFYTLLAYAQPVRLLGATADVRHLRRPRGGTVDLRDGDALERLGGPFDELAHLVDVRRPNSARTRGRFNIPSVGLFVFRLRGYPVTMAPPRSIEEVAPELYTFSLLGNDTALLTRPEREAGPTHIAEELNVPAPIRRRALDRDLRACAGEPGRCAYYGPGKSLAIWTGDPPALLPPSEIVVADLSGWEESGAARYRPEAAASRYKAAVDPERGRIVFALDHLPEVEAGIQVTYHYGFSADVGGGEYDRPLSRRSGSTVYRVRGRDEFLAQLGPWLTGPLDQQPAHAVIELADSGEYVPDRPLHVRLGAGHSLQIRAANRCRPVIRLLDFRAPQVDSLRVSGEPGSSLTLDGLLVMGRGLQVGAPARARAGAGGQVPGRGLGHLAIRHCTLLPGWELGLDCVPRRAEKSSLDLDRSDARITIEHSILGSIQVLHDEVRQDPMRVTVSDSILDAAGPRFSALEARGGGHAHATVRIVRSTVLGAIWTHAIELGENAIFTGGVHVARRLLGCMRFCYVTGPRTPRRFQCQPDLVEAVVTAELPPGPQREEAKARERRRVRPVFDSTRYGTPSYCRLAATCATEITEGADDESEMGVFHDLYQPLRAASLRARVDEFTPAGVDAGIFYAT